MKVVLILLNSSRPFLCLLSARVWQWQLGKGINPEILGNQAEPGGTRRQTCCQAGTSEWKFSGPAWALVEREESWLGTWMRYQQRYTKMQLGFCHSVWKFPKMSHFLNSGIFRHIFGIFEELLSIQNVNIARFARKFYILSRKKFLKNAKNWRKIP